MPSTAIFTLALGLQSPWYIEKVDLEAVDNQLSELHIYINFEGGNKSNISIVSIDMSPAFISGADKYLPNAQVVLINFI